MKKTVSLAFAGMLLAAAAHAGSFTEKNAAKARKIIDQAIEAHGGEALVDGLRTLVVEIEGYSYAVGQSRGTEPPWDKTYEEGYDAIDLDNAVYIRHRNGRGESYEQLSTNIINGEESYRLDFRAGTVASIAEPDYEGATGPLIRVTPALLVRALKEREGNAHYLGEVEADGEAFDVVGFSMTVGPAINMYFDKKKHVLRRSERIFSGYGLVEYHFDDYKNIDGVPFNQAFTLKLNGEVNTKRKILSVDVNAPLDAYLDVDERLVAIPAVEPDPLARHELGDGVWLVGGNNSYAIFVDMGDYLFAAGGVGGLPGKIELLREAVGDKPIRYGMLTHHHSDHVQGVPAYEAEGATLITAKAHEKTAREAAEDGENLKVKPVEDRMVLEDAGRRVEIIDIGPTAHTEHMLIAYLPDEQLVFEADHFTLPATGPAAPASKGTSTFAEALARQDIRVSRIATAHSARVATMDDLSRALQAEVFQASR